MKKTVQINYQKNDHPTEMQPVTPKDRRSLSTRRRKASALPDQTIQPPQQMEGELLSNDL